MKVQLFYVEGCPNLDAARRLLRRCLDAAGLACGVEECFGAYPSPTVLVDGVDVMGNTAVHGPCCRLDLPTEEQVARALCGRLGGA